MCSGSTIGLTHQLVSAMYIDHNSDIEPKRIWSVMVIIYGYQSEVYIAGWSRTFHITHWPSFYLDQSFLTKCQDIYNPSSHPFALFCQKWYNVDQIGYCDFKARLAPSTTYGHLCGQAHLNSSISII